MKKKKFGGIGFWFVLKKIEEILPTIELGLILSSNKLQLVDTCNFSSLFFITLPRTKKRM